MSRLFRRMHNAFESVKAGTYDQRHEQYDANCRVERNVRALVDKVSLPYRTGSHIRTGVEQESRAEVHNESEHERKRCADNESGFGLVFHDDSHHACEGYACKRQRIIQKERQRRNNVSRFYELQQTVNETDDKSFIRAKEIGVKDNGQHTRNGNASAVGVDLKLYEGQRERERDGYAGKSDTASVHFFVASG